MKKIIVAIDGFSSTGKSTLAKELANHLHYNYVDTGAMYRAVTLFAMNNGYITSEYFDVESLINSLRFIELKFIFNKEVGFAEMYLNDENVENQIRTLQVSNFVSLIAEISEVRAKLVEQQQKMGADKGLVMDGRDIGTVVFPNAEVKIFMSASPETRARRRFDELTAAGQDVTFDQILKNVEDRDHIDTHREDSPLVKAEDAVEVDNSALSKVEQFDLVLSIVEKSLAL